MSGVSPERLSPEAVLALSHRMGNSALAETIARREAGAADLTSVPVPSPLQDMEAAPLSEGTAELISPVDFAGLPALETGAGLAMGGV